VLQEYVIDFDDYRSGRTIADMWKGKEGTTAI
jgi:hypothetical protein